MDKEKLKERLNILEAAKDQHQQDILEIEAVIGVVQKQISEMPDEEQVKSE